jgi:hypothetical protein
MPILEKGFLPVLIPVEKRLAYVESLAAWQMASGGLKPGGSLIGDEKTLVAFRVLCVEAFEASQTLLSEAMDLQDKRRGAS